MSDTDLRYYYWWGASGCRGSCIHEDGGEEMVIGVTVGFCVEVGGVIICVVLAENYGLIHDALENEGMFGMDVSGLCGDDGVRAGCGMRLFFPSPPSSTQSHPWPVFGPQKNDGEGEV